MGEITLVRHGQANSAATNEADYDRLSELGHRQAEWLGAWMRAHDRPYDVVLSGTLRRQRETLTNLGYPDAERDARLNEIAYYDLTDEMSRVHGTARHDPEDFVTHFPATLTAWRAGEIGGPETYAAFTDRVRDVMAMAAQPGKRVLCVSSGGIIAQAISDILGLDIPQMARIALPIFNTSVHRIRVMEHGPLLVSFNGTPHLDSADRADDRTFY
ncbi:histidine phosphatase family protein [Salipiger sp. IMCC34102]|uniref:histidine phosphatase family protein n=1 Tax=Salipiger sp. IMCC34102 TaxID=2510647 RepID=UPI00101CBEF6|nr:histidine phosphatase family protein [Salipiger sp. IMCC34102]RYH01541.1 histidine phosphatase family protein [Salipiger sp. IMCC34102]